MKTLSRDLIWEFGKAKLQELIGERCWNCGRELTVKEVFDDRCQSCSKKMSENPQEESPF